MLERRITPPTNATPFDSLQHDLTSNGQWAVVRGPWRGEQACFVALSRLIDDLTQAITIAMLVMLPYILNLRASPHGLITDTSSRWRKLLEG